MESKPCEEPIAYTIGSFDRRFGISRENFLNALDVAEAIWEKPIKKDLFVYLPEQGELMVNLIYDYRQEVTSTLSGLEDVLEENEASYNILQNKYAGLKIKYDSAKSIYNTRVETFNDENNVYEKQVEVWNNGSKTSKKQFDQLEERRIILEAKAQELKTLEGELNEMVREINALAERLNRLASSLNLNVERFNTIGASRGETFTGGIYSQVEGRQSIDIYEFSSQDKLVRILAHELGHALGLEHVEEPEAIMYYLNEDEAGVLSKADLAALQTLCYTDDIKN